MGRIFNIQHFSVHDGPGIRTVIFFKGCNLSCKWCHNPESIDFRKSLLFYDEKCIGCGACFQNCPNKCHYVDSEGIHQILAERCKQCFDCSRSCYAEALTSVGEDVDEAFVMDAILSQKPYFQKSNGGVTFSGGECMLQPVFLQKLLKECSKNGIHTSVDTAGCVDWSCYEKIIPWTDLFLYDLKAFDPLIHRELTGADNHTILQNFAELYQRGVNLRVRIPYIKTCNDAELPKLARFLKDFPLAEVEILPYHAMGSSKYKALRQRKQCVNKQTEVSYTPNKEEVETARRLFVTV